MQSNLPFLLSFVIGALSTFIFLECTKLFDDQPRGICHISTQPPNKDPFLHQEGSRSYYQKCVVENIDHPACDLLSFLDDSCFASTFYDERQEDVELTKNCLYTSCFIRFLTHEPTRVFMRNHFIIESVFDFDYESFSEPSEIIDGADGSTYTNWN